MDAVCLPSPCRALRANSDYPLPCENSSFTPFAFPVGLQYRHPDLAPCPAPGELGVHNAWLPVTHTCPAGSKGARGLWMYYARGCSDMLWNVGRTLFARNRCHAALLLEQLDRAGCNEREAARRAAAGMSLRNFPELNLVRFRAGSWLGMHNASMAELLIECARGMFGNCSGSTWNPNDGTLNMCTCMTQSIHGRARPWRMSSKRRALVLSALAGSDALGPRIGTLLRKHSFDSLQLWQQPQGGGSLFWTTELWDVRELQMKTPALETHLGSKSLDGRAKLARHFADDGSSSEACKPTPRFVECMACAHSSLATACDYEIAAFNESILVTQAWEVAKMNNSRLLLRTRMSRLEQAVITYASQVLPHKSAQSHPTAGTSRKWELVRKLINAATTNVATAPTK